MKNNIKKDRIPIFIHSLFRSGSTYLFNAFRRSGSGYWCYQEPLNEDLLLLDSNELLDVSKEMSRYLNHPPIEKPYYYEFHPVANEINNVFQQEFSYQQYFVSKDEDISSLKRYFTFLSKRSQGRPVFQCCRTSGRVGCLKSEVGGLHIFLWRHPWNQWWSYKIDNYFDQRNLLIANAQNIPPFLAEVIIDLELEQFDSWEQTEQQISLNRNRLDSKGSYKLFYALWCHAFLEAKPSCGIAIDIDQLSCSKSYRKDIVNQLDDLGVIGIDFSDCEMPQSIYGQNETKFYCKIEQEIHDVLVKHGYSQEDMKELKVLNEERISSVKKIMADNDPIVRESMEARKIVKRYESELSDAMNSLSEAEAKAEQAEAKAGQAEAKAGQAEAKAGQAEAKAGQAEAKTQKIETKVEQAKVETRKAEMRAGQAEDKVEQVKSELEMLHRSHSWRITAPLRSIMNLIKSNDR